MGELNLTRCVQCGFARANRLADDMAQADDFDAITGLFGPDAWLGRCAVRLPDSGVLAGPSAAICMASGIRLAGRRGTGGIGGSR